MVEQKSLIRWSSAARAQRMALFWRLVEALPERPNRILDLGGMGAFWDRYGLRAYPELEVTTLNLEPHPPIWEQVHPLVADARDLSAWADHSVDVVFSNSLIEHLGGWEDQRQFAREVQRIARNYFIQTPNRSFFMEPHFMVPGFHFLPLFIRTRLVQRFALGWMPRIPDPEQAARAVKQIRLLTASEMRDLFPAAALWRERVGVFTKSLVAIGGAWRTTPPGIVDR